MSDNINVSIRMRPLLQNEIAEKEKIKWTVEEDTIYLLENGKKFNEGYTFDKVFGATSKNEDIYKSVVKPVIESAIDGINATVFAYGQTSSGKTYTMSGTTMVPGIITYSVNDLFELIKADMERKYLLRVSYIEIYNEKLIDLLDKNNKSIKIHEDTVGNITVSCKETVVTTVNEILVLMRKGNRLRQIGETNMNERSSRSHTIFRIIIESTPTNEFESEERSFRISHINLVDLAGSERVNMTGATGIRLKEGGHINKSLSTLTLVIKQVSEGVTFVNYRDSKLTRLLQQCLGGNSKAALIAAITPTDVETTQSTLAFAQRAKKIKNKPVVNCSDQDTLIQKYVEELANVTKQLTQAQSHNQNLARSKEELEDRLRCLQNNFVSNNDDINQSKRRHTIHLTSKSDDSNTFLPRFLTPHRIDVVSRTQKTVTVLESVTEVVEQIEEVDGTEQQRAQQDELTELSNTSTPKLILRERIDHLNKELGELQDFTRLEKNVKQDYEAVLKREVQESRAKYERLDKKYGVSLCNNKMLEKKCKSLTEKLQEIESKNETDKSGSQVRALEDKCTTLAHKLQNLEAKYQQENVTSSNLLAEKKQIQNQLEQYTSRYEQLDKEYYISLSKNKALEERCKSLTDKLEEIETKNETEKSILQIRTLEEKCASLTQKLRNLEVKNQEENVISSNLLLEKRQIENQLQEHASRYERLDKEYYISLSNNKALEERCKSLMDKLEKIGGKKEAEESISQIRTLEEKCASLTQKLRNLEVQNQEENVISSNLLLEKRQIENQLEEHASRYERLDKEHCIALMNNKALEERCKYLMDKLEEIGGKNEAEESISQIRTLEENCASLTHKLRNLEVKYQEENVISSNLLLEKRQIQNQLEEHASRYERLDKEHCIALSNNKALEERCKSLKDKLQEIESKKEPEESISQIRTLEEKCASLTHKLQTLEVKYQEENVISSNLLLEKRQIENQLEEHTSRYEQLDKEHCIALSNNKVLEERCKSLKDKLQEIESKKEPEESISQIRTLEETCASLTHKLQNLEVKYQEENVISSNLLLEKRQIENQLEEHASRYERLDKEHCIALSNNKALEERCKSLMDKLQEIESKKEAGESISQIRTLEEKCASLTHKLRNLEVKYQEENVISSNLLLEKKQIEKQLLEYTSRYEPHVVDSCNKNADRSAVDLVTVLEEFSPSDVCRQLMFLQGLLAQESAQKRPPPEETKTRNCPNCLELKREIATIREEIERSKVNQTQSKAHDACNLQSHIDDANVKDDSVRNQDSPVKSNEGRESLMNKNLPFAEIGQVNNDRKILGSIENTEKNCDSNMEKSASKKICPQCANLKKEIADMQKLLNQSTTIQYCESCKELQRKCKFLERQHKILTVSNKKLSEELKLGLEPCARCPKLESVQKEKEFNIVMLSAELEKANKKVHEVTCSKDHLVDNYNLLAKKLEEAKGMLCSKCQDVKREDKEVQVQIRHMQVVEDSMVVSRSEYLEDMEKLRMLKNLARRRKDQIIALQNQLQQSV